MGGCVPWPRCREPSPPSLALQVAEQLFRPLVTQTIHWFTRNTQYESPDTIALLEAILVRMHMLGTPGTHATRLWYESETPLYENEPAMCWHRMALSTLRTPP